MKTILGTKERMTQIFDEDGRVHPATTIKTGPNVVIQKKTTDTDGYNAVSVAYGERSQKNINKAQLGQFKEMGNFRYVKEFQIDDSKLAEVNVGDKIELSSFEKGDEITITSYSKGKGFQGVVKRHKFAGGRRSHGNKHSEREAGSIGVGGVQRVIKGTRMAGRMGSDKVTLKKVLVLGTDIEKGLLYVKGSVPGRKGTLIQIKG